MGGKFLKTVVKVLIFAVYVLLILGIIGGIIYLVGNAESGMYVTYGTQKLVSGNSGITIEWNEENNTAAFQIGNSDDWGVYTVKDCTAKIVPNVNDETDFEYTISGISGTQKYSSETDLTAAFVEDYSSYSGNGFTINEDGGFTLYVDGAYSDSVLGSDYCMQYMLYKVYGGKEITLSSAVDITTYPYFAVKVTSPDGKSSITIPFMLNEIETDGTDTEQVISYYLNPNKTTEIDLSELGITVSDISVSFKTSGGCFFTCTAMGDSSTGYTKCWNFTKTLFDSTVADYMIKSAAVTDGVLTIQTNSLSPYYTSSSEDGDGNTTKYNKFVIGNLYLAEYTADQSTFEAAVAYNKEFNQSSYYICDIADNSTGMVIKSFCFRIYLTYGGNYDDGLFDIY